MRASMRSTQRTSQASKKMGKRIYTLKELAQRNFATVHQVASEDRTDTAPTFNLVTIQEDVEDLLIDEPIEPKGKSETIEQTPGIAMPMDLIKRLINKELEQTATQLGLEKAELQAWLDLQVMAPALTLLSLLRIARTYDLDPLKEEVALALYDDSHWQAYITVEGYSKLLNRHPAFDGIVFTLSAEHTNGIPIWMECTIYRKDRSKPIVVREYFEEVKTEQVIWQKMPRRMLRHRVMQQCARLAVG